MPSSRRWFLSVALAASFIAPWQAHAATAEASTCQESAAAECFRSFTPPGAGGALHYYSSLDPDAPDAPAAGGSAGPTRALIAMHGHSRDADKTFEAALRTPGEHDALWTHLRALLELPPTSL